MHVLREHFPESHTHFKSGFLGFLFIFTCIIPAPTLRTAGVLSHFPPPIFRSLVTLEMDLIGKAEVYAVKHRHDCILVLSTAK